MQTIDQLERENVTSTKSARSGVSVDLATLISNANILMSNEELALAANILRAALGRDSKNRLVLKMLSECLEKLGRLEELLQIQKAIVKFNFGFDAIFSLASTQYRMGLDDEALVSYFECLAILQNRDERLFEIYKNIGNIFVRQKDYEGAEEYYNKAHTFKIQEDVLLVNFGTLEVQRGDFDKAIFCFRQAIVINPNNDKAWVGLALIHDHFGDYQLAMGNLEKAIDLNSTNKTSIQLYAVLGLRNGQIDKPLKILNNAINLFSDDETLSLLLIEMLCKKGHLNEAKIEMEKAFVWNPKSTNLKKIYQELSSGK